MKQFFEERNYSDLKREVEALRKRIEDLESGQARPKVAGCATGRRRLSRRPALALLAVVVVVLLALGVLGAQSKRDALFIDPNGNVGIGTTGPKATLDVAGDSRFNGAVGINREPIAGQNLVITPTKGNIPFNVTDPTNSINWLSVLSDGRVSMNGGNVGIEKTLDVKGNTVVGGDLNLGNSALYFTKTDHDHSGIGNTQGYAAIENSKNYNGLMILGRMNESKTLRVVRMWDFVGIGGGAEKIPKAQLDVVGEIRGNPWRSQMFEWKKDQPAVKMTKSDHSVCFLTLVSGYFYGGGEVVQISDTGGYWYLGGQAVQRDVRAQARCTGAPDDSW